MTPNEKPTVGPRATKAERLTAARKAYQDALSATEEEP